MSALVTYTITGGGERGNTKKLCAHAHAVSTQPPLHPVVCILATMTCTWSTTGPDSLCTVRSKHSCVQGVSACVSRAHRQLDLERE